MWQSKRTQGCRKLWVKIKYRLSGHTSLMIYFACNFPDLDPRGHTCQQFWFWLYDRTICGLAPVNCNNNNNNTYSIQHSLSWEANRFSASQQIPHILMNSKVHYRIHKCPLPVPIRSQLEPGHTPTTHFLKIHLNIIPSMPGFPQWSLSLRFPHQHPVHASPIPHMRYMPRPSHSSQFYHPHNIGWGVQIVKLFTM